MSTVVGRSGPRVGPAPGKSSRSRARRSTPGGRASCTEFRAGRAHKGRHTILTGDPEATFGDVLARPECTGRMKGRTGGPSHRAPGRRSRHVVLIPAAKPASVGRAEAQSSASARLRAQQREHDKEAVCTARGLVRLNDRPMPCAGRHPRPRSRAHRCGPRQRRYPLCDDDSQALEWSA